MKDWQRRVIQEKDALDDKREALFRKVERAKAASGFLPSFTEGELLLRQYHVMTDYSRILEERIFLFEYEE